MFIVYGTRRMKKTLAHSGLLTCTTCSQPNYFEVVRERVWVTLFWIPIFPVSSKYFQVCPHCSCAYPMDKRDAKALAQAAKEQQLPQ